MPEPAKTLTPTQAPALASVVGFALWLIAYFLFEPEWALAVLWLGALVHVPLALGLGTDGATKWGRPYWSLPASMFLVAGFVTDWWWLVLPWAAFFCWCGMAGAWRLIRLGVRRPSALADVGQFWLIISAAATTAYAAGWAAFGFAEILVLLLGVHQMFAGLVLHTIAARIVDWRPGRLPTIAAICVAVGNPVVATGIIVTRLDGPPAIEFAAATFLACAVIVLGWMQLFLALWPKSGLPWLSRVLLVISDLSIGTAMTLAILYAWGLARGYPTLTIPEMIFWHGTLNALGFGLCGLVGWTIAGTRSQVPAS
jgi:hypothetical protein